MKLINIKRQYSTLITCIRCENNFQSELLLFIANTNTHTHDVLKSIGEILDKINIVRCSSSSSGQCQSWFSRSLLNPILCICFFLLPSHSLSFRVCFLYTGKATVSLASEIIPIEKVDCNDMRTEMSNCSVAF